MSKQWKQKSSAILTASVFGLTLAAPALGQNTSATKPSTATSTQTTNESKPNSTKADGQKKDQRAAVRDMRVSTLIGKDVRNPQGEDLGDIKDVILDVNNGRVHYVVLSFGGFLGVGDKLFAYPAQAFKPAMGNDELILTVDKSKLKNAPGFDAKAYPDWNIPDYRNQVDRYFESPAAEPLQTNARLVRASDLIGKDVNDPTGRDLGEVEDVVINMNGGDVRYAVLEFDKSWSLNNKLFAFPLGAFDMGKQWKDDLVLSVSKDTLNNVPGFDKDSWPNVNDPKWVTDIDRYLIATAVVPMPSTTNDALFVKLDKNRDGTLSSDEAKADTSVQAKWKEIDNDNDGRVTRSEFDSAYRK